MYVLWGILRYSISSSHPPPPPPPPPRPSSSQRRRPRNLLSRQPERRTEERLVQQEQQRPASDSLLSFEPQTEAATNETPVAVGEQVEEPALVEVDTAPTQTPPLAMPNNDTMVPMAETPRVSDPTETEATTAPLPRQGPLRLPPDVSLRLRGRQRSRTRGGVSGISYAEGLRAVLSKHLGV